jgi:hypothetical protein
MYTLIAILHHIPDHCDIEAGKLWCTVITTRNGDHNISMPMTLQEAKQDAHKWIATYKIDWGIDLVMDTVTASLLYGQQFE